MDVRWSFYGESLPSEWQLTSERSHLDEIRPGEHFDIHFTHPDLADPIERGFRVDWRDARLASHEDAHTSWRVLNL